MHQEKHFPTFLGLVLLLVAIFVGVILSNKNANPITKASTDCQPINPQVTNISYNSVSISFTTNSDCLANLKINDLIINDVRFTNTSINPFANKIHYFDIPSLTEDTEYNFIPIVGGQTFENSSYTFKTAQKPNTSPPSSNLAWGKVLNPDKTPATEGIIYLNIPGASSLSSFITSSGNWNIPLSSSFNQDQTDWFNTTDVLTEDIVIIASDQSQTQVSNLTSKNDPVEDIILGQNRLSADESDIDQTSSGIIPEVSITPAEKNLTISNPQDNETVSSQKPDFFGTGPAGTKLSVKVESSVAYTGEITVNDDGSWNWSPPSNLTPGEHTITITTADNQTISHNFIVLAAEEQPAFSASSSSKTVIPTKIPTPTNTPTLAPTATSKPTLKPTLEPTSEDVESAVTQAPTDQLNSSQLPKTGSTTPTFLLIFVAVLSLACAVFFFQKD